jgi:hypothetical protein
MIELEHFVVVWPVNDETRELPPEALEFRVKGFSSTQEAMQFQSLITKAISSYVPEDAQGLSNAAN